MPPRDVVVALDERARAQAFELPLTDVGNAQRLVREHGADLRRVPGLGWHVWDGRRWRRDDNGEVERRAKGTARRMIAQAAALDDRPAGRELVKHALRSEGLRSIRAMVALAETEREVVTRADDLDADLYLLNVTNGTVDLRTGELRPHSRRDLLTKLAPVDYQPEAKHSLLDSFLARITGGSADLARFLQRAVGYSLTGETSEEKLFFAHGPEATGKSTLLEAVKALLGDYATTADFETFLKRRGDAGVRNDIARIAGTRLVVSVEVDEGKAFAEGLLKLVTGGDTVAARFLYREAFEFTPRFKLWLAANHRPAVNADDGAMWRRIVQVPFVETIPPAERDPDVKRRLKHDPEVQTALLAWAVAGCLDWQLGGLRVPQAVADYTNDYRHESDPLRGWLEDECTLDANRTTLAADLRASYEAWCRRNSEPPLTPQKFGQKLGKRGLHPGRIGHDRSRAWHRIALRSADQ